MKTFTLNNKNEKLISVFVEKNTGELFMQNLGYKPNDSFVGIKSKVGNDLTGFDIHEKELETIVSLAIESNIYIEYPNEKLFNNAELIYKGKGDFVVTSKNELSVSEKKVIEIYTGNIIGKFIDIVGTSSGRATFYNSIEEQNKAENEIHEKLFKLNRGLYMALLTLEGVTEFSVQKGVLKLLSQPGTKNEGSLLSIEQETKLIKLLVDKLSTARMFKLFSMFRENRVNNSRTRKLILQTILSSKKIELWSTKYKRKIRLSLEHAMGKRVTGILYSILSKNKDERNEKENKILYSNIGKYIGKNNIDKVYECVGFILGHEKKVSQPLLLAYSNSKKDIDAGSGLPYEVLEGIRSTYHKDISNDYILKITSKYLTQGQKLAFQKKSSDLGINIELDLKKYDPVKLYIYSFERGLTDEVKTHLRNKARLIANKFPLSFEHSGILIDSSASMYGHKTNAMKPMAIALAVRDFIQECSKKSSIVYCGGKSEYENNYIIKPSGYTSLAEGFLELAKKRPDTIFIISDGYENAPAGRLSEVIEALRKLGINIPVYQFSPVFSSEAEGVKKLCADTIYSLPVTNTSLLGIALMKSLLISEPFKALSGILKITLSLIEEEKNLLIKDSSEALV